MTMAWGGARGETAAEMGKVLHLEGTPGEVMATSGSLARSLQDPSRPIVFRIANQLFGHRTNQLVPSFVQQMKAAFGAPVELLDFEKAPEPARVHINEWVEGRTERRIKGLIPPGGIVPATRLVIVNAIYFLGDWQMPFNKDWTRPAPFFLTASRKKDVPTMHNTAAFRIAQRDGVTALEMPYKGGELSMLFLVPDAVEGLADVERSFDAAKLDALVGALRRERVVLALPKFEVNPIGAVQLGGDLKALGMPIAFDRRQADFTGIANPPDPKDRVFLGDVFHKGFVRVDEKGTEAAAATAMGIVGGAIAEDPPRPLKVDRPFLFLIRDNSSGLVLFLGRVSDPVAP
jgi:serpin B